MSKHYRQLKPFGMQVRLWLPKSGFDTQEEFADRIPIAASTLSRMMYHNPQRLGGKKLPDWLFRMVEVLHEGNEGYSGMTSLEEAYEFVNSVPRERIPVEEWEELYSRLATLFSRVQPIS